MSVPGAWELRSAINTSASQSREAEAELSKQTRPLCMQQVDRVWFGLVALFQMASQDILWYRYSFIHLPAEFAPHSSSRLDRFLFNTIMIYGPALVEKPR